MTPAVDVAVTDPTHVSQARRTASALAQRGNFSEAQQGRIALVVTEIGTNLLKHAKGGRILLSAVTGLEAIDVFGLDQGPGIANLAESLRDGHSTAGSPGTGLGAIQRQSDEWDVYTAPGQGTVIRARFFRDKSRPSGAAAFETGGVVVPYPGETESGDAWAFRADTGKLSILAVDGLGHGTLAADAARAAVTAFHADPGRSGAQLVEEIGHALRSTRGAALAVAEIAPGAGVLSYTGIGNIAAVIHTGDTSRHLVSMNGISGHQSSRPKTFEYPWTPDSLLVIHSDGLRTRWNLADYRGLAMKSAPLIAGVLLRDAGRGTDDASVAVVRGLGSRHAA